MDDEKNEQTNVTENEVVPVQPLENKPEQEQKTQPEPQPQQVQTQQPQQPQQPQYYDPNQQYGQQPQYRPIYVDPNAQYNPRPAKTKKTGAMVCGIIFTILALIMTGVTIFEYLSVFLSLFNSSAQQAAGTVTFIAFLFGYGWFTFLPAIAFSITGICCCASGTKSILKGQKAASIVFLVFSILTLVGLGFLFIFAFLFAGTPR